MPATVAPLAQVLAALISDSERAVTDERHDHGHVFDAGPGVVFGLSSSGTGEVVGRHTFGKRVCGLGCDTRAAPTFSTGGSRTPPAFAGNW